MTSDTYPKGLTDIHERLVSRFDSGLTVAIEPPELGDARGHPDQQGAHRRHDMPRECLLRGQNVALQRARTRRRALRKILAYSRFNQKEISIQLARDALRDLLSIQNRQISVENIQKTVADYYKIKVADMYSKKRPPASRGPPDRHVPGQGTDRRACPRSASCSAARPHHRIACGAQDRRRTPAMTELNQQLHVLEQTLKG